jgi:hypothetical protein
MLWQSTGVAFVLLLLLLLLLLLCCCAHLPLSVMVTCCVPRSTSTVTTSPKPPCTSSTALSSTSHSRWCRPLGPVLPMYMPGRLRTGSNPSSTCAVQQHGMWVGTT